MIHYAYDRLFRHQYWGIGIVRAPIQSFLSPEFKPQAEWLPNPAEPPTRFQADPFAIQQDGRTFLLYEEFDYPLGKGRIAACELTDQGPTSATTIIETDSHLSYPYPVCSDGHVYCVPESAEAGEVAIYEALELPGKWRKKAVLLPDVPALDSTIFRHGDWWWLACGRGDARDYGQLHLWFADDLCGPWRPHRLNPVKSDICSARPAGTPFYHQGELIRPAQDCAQGYGAAVVLNHVLKLTPTEFSEEPLRRIEPLADGVYPQGIHTLAALGDMTLVDGKRFIFHHRELARRCGRAIRRLVA